jgi:ATP-dependent DNA helicase RecG
MSFLKETKIEYLKGVGPARAEILNSELGIYTMYDLLFYFPFRYVDRSKMTSLHTIEADGGFVQCVGKIVSLNEVNAGKRSKARLVAELSDGRSVIELIWFQGIRWIKTKLQLHETYVVFGRAGRFGSGISISHPEIETYDEFLKQPFSEGLQPMYNSGEKLRTRGLDSKGVSKLTKTLLSFHIDKIRETLPQWVMDEAKVCSLKQAIAGIHFPHDFRIQKEAERRLKFEEIFFFQLNMQKSKIARDLNVKGIRFNQVGSLFHDFYEGKLPFQLTGAQKKVIREIWNDCRSGRQMNRLLQGDVGSGKTVVALMSMLLAGGNGYQACLMAPTEILAQQHFKTISSLIEGMDVRVELLTGSTKTVKRKQIQESLRDGTLGFLVGTHALIEDTVEFSNLGLAIIDEQHRFGVAQRAKLWKKAGFPPHILVMTATPIPRTLAMTTHGDLDVSVIDEFPLGEKKIKTMHFKDSQRLRMYKLVKEQVALGRQIYFVFPLINESQKLDLKALMEQYDEIAEQFPKPQYTMGIVHGGMSSQDKEFEMDRFKNGITQILVSTTVIEVGVDVANATVMIIENAEHFGLSQLHQLRGRIGRGIYESYCILMTKNEIGESAQRRIGTMLSTLDGFKISEVDLELRGPGDPEGTQQSGQLPFKLLNLVYDARVIAFSNNLVRQILNDDPELKQEKNKLLKLALEEWKRDQAFWARVG